jgi:hypothetical protein
MKEIHFSGDYTLYRVHSNKKVHFPQKQVKLRKGHARDLLATILVYKHVDDAMLRLPLYFLSNAIGSKKL